MSKCNCFADRQKRLAEKNATITGLVEETCVDNSTLDLVSAVKIVCTWINLDKVPAKYRRMHPTLEMTHCPFCGVKLKAEEAPELEQGD